MDSSSIGSLSNINFYENRFSIKIETMKQSKLICINSDIDII
jgi:hypothetical protein